MSAPKRHTSKGLRRPDNSTNRDRQQENTTEVRNKYKAGNASVTTRKKFMGPAGHEAGDSWETSNSVSRLKESLSIASKLDVNATTKSGSKSAKRGDPVLHTNRSTRKHHTVDSGKNKTDSVSISEQKREMPHNQFGVPGENVVAQWAENVTRITKKHSDTKSNSLYVPKESRSQDRERSDVHVSSSAQKSHETVNRRPPEKGDSKFVSNLSNKSKEYQETTKEMRLPKASIENNDKDNVHNREEATDERHINSPLSKDRSDIDEYMSDFDDAASDWSSAANSVTNTPSKETVSVPYPCNTIQKGRKPSVISAAPQLIDFNRSLTIHKRGIYQRLQQRATDLRRLIELELDSCLSLFELKPLDEYSSYMLRFGKANRCQAQTQTQEDAIDKDVQTALIEYCPGGGVWTQWPPLDRGECSGRPRNSRVMGSLSTSCLQSHVDSISETYMDDVLKDFIGVFENKSSLKGSKRGVHLLPNSIISQMNIMLTILKEEQVPELVESLQDRHIVPDEADFIQPLPQCNDESSENEATALQPSLHGDSGCVACAFAPFNGDALLTIHCPTTILMPNPLDDLTGFVYPAGEIIFVWSISSGSGAPKHQLYCPGLSETGFCGANITRAVFSPDVDASMVIGGLADGSLCIWDLRSSSYGLCSIQILAPPPSASDSSSYTRTVYAKAPIYSTSGVDIQQITPGHATNFGSESHSTIGSSAQLQQSNQIWEPCTRSQNKRHSVPIVDVQLAHSANRPETAASSFQCVVLDQSGELSLWMVLRPSRSKTQNIYETLAGSQTDLGLRPAEYVVQMICLAYIVPTLSMLSPVYCSFYTINGQSTLNPDKLCDIQEKCGSPMRTKPKINATTLGLSSRGYFLLGFSSGLIMKLARSLNQLVYPRQFQQPSNRATVRCIAVHPITEFEVFLAGYADGFIRLYHFGRPNPLYEWNLSENRNCQLSAVKLIWSHNRPAVFFCLDSSGRVSSFDMIEGMSHLRDSTIRSDSSQCGSPIQNPGMSIHVPAVKTGSNRVNDFALSRGVLVSSNGRPQIISAFALIYPEAVKIHWLDQQWSQMIENELPRTTDLLHHLFEDS
ncbi:hypothetical protein FGIG_03969 [Fasciola gigantica]|uniref:WD repeat-containing protein 60 n=1 Tax=Fasciola gigantica TaxID=46835 RepID=A0A504Y427_FASGI|nr:hypothetical protein FGIG_03969 [Fasciola gigantica]